ncbi:hypothetical protein GGR55DRAFT_81247 [Xylaria sp. FL0064]|nr:hypothetical protein GGR55DRAFT_81247 [Xylaria sp. FL0064]
MGTGGYILVAYVVEPAKRPTYTGIMDLSYCFASVLGPLVGGAITTSTTWRWCFYINLPVGAVSLSIFVLSQNLFKDLSIGLRQYSATDIAIDHGSHRGPFRPYAIRSQANTASWKEKFLPADFVGVMLVLGSLISYSLATQYGGQTKPWHSGTMIGLFVTAVVLVGIFAAWKWHAGERAMIVPRLLTQQRVGIGSAFAFLFAGNFFFFFFLIVYYLPIYFQSIDNASEVPRGLLSWDDREDPNAGALTHTHR